MALPCLAEGCCPLLLLLVVLLTMTCSGRGEVLLIHESGKGTAWGYSHLPSTFPLTWSQARSACEAIPGSMLARVDGWQAEAAVEEYLREAAFVEPVWLANRQTLPEVLEDEQREMNHIGNAGVLGSDDLSMGGDVGVTLRCAVYRAGEGLVHELCSEAAVSAALCVQRLSSERQQLDVCPASSHRQWFLVNSHTETATSEPHQQTTVNVIGLHQCHHHHHHHHGHMVRVVCHPQEGWERTTCSSEASNHQQLDKVSRAGHRQQSSASSPSSALTPTHLFNDGYEQRIEQKEYFSLAALQESRRRRRSAEFQPTPRVQTSSVASSLLHSIPAATPAHRSAAESHQSDVADKVMLYITGHKKTRSDHEKQREDTIQPRHSTHAQTENRKHTDPRQHDAPPTLLKDKHTGKVNTYNDETMLDPAINEIETKAESHYHTEGKQPESHPAEKKDYLEAIHYSASVEESERHTRTSPAQAAESNESQGNEEIKDQKTPSTVNTGTTLMVGVGPIFVHGPETQNNTSEEDFQPDSTERNFRALVFPEDSTLENSNEDNLFDANKRPSTSGNDSSGEGSSSEVGKTAPSKETTTTPSRPIIFPRVESDSPASDENVNEDSLLADNAEKFEPTAQPAEETTAGAANSDMLPDVPISESEPVGSATPEDSAAKTEHMTNESDKSNDDSAESDDAEEEIEDPNTNTPRPEESTLNPFISDTTSVSTHQEPNSSPSSPSNADPTVTTEKPKTQGTRLLIAQIFKSLFG